MHVMHIGIAKNQVMNNMMNEHYLTEEEEKIIKQKVLTICKYFKINPDFSKIEDRRKMQDLLYIVQSRFNLDLGLRYHWNNIRRR